MAELRVSSHGKVVKYISFAKRLLQQSPSVQITALGIAILNVIATGELFKGQLANLQQIVKTTMTNGVSIIIITLILDLSNDMVTQNSGSSKKCSRRKKRRDNTNSGYNSATSKADHKQWRKVPSPSHKGCPATDTVPRPFISVSKDMNHDCRGKLMEFIVLDTVGREANHHLMDDSVSRRQQQKEAFVTHCKDLSMVGETT
ncbi:OLC1v1008984C1 [Oldenlandia corymbosa var. corymbosa]|uniref:OLC1v1008984C1 n=1 Tax=Oldenlandia corymbosa var. corymbosa TaxID=529605 RepID=A0AAV1DN61_OLDCO|nr:OLC1v1008984C1 [Oldenlandia corymbosa var. corymbosa]